MVDRNIEKEENQEYSDTGAMDVHVMDDVETWPDSTTRAFAHALDAACVKCFALDYVAAVQEYRILEAQFLPLMSERPDHAVEIRRRVAEMILDAARGKKAPFEVCMAVWNDLVQLGFSTIERQRSMTWFFADCCRIHRQVDIGLALLEPLIAELEGLLGKPGAATDEVSYYQHELEPLVKLRSKLQAQRA